MGSRLGTGSTHQRHDALVLLVRPVAIHGAPALGHRSRRHARLRRLCRPRQHSLPLLPLPAASLGLRRASAVSRAGRCQQSPLRAALRAVQVRWRQGEVCNVSRNAHCRLKCCVERAKELILDHRLKLARWLGDDVLVAGRGLVRQMQLHAFTVRGDHRVVLWGSSSPPRFLGGTSSGRLLYRLPPQRTPARGRLHRLRLGGKKGRFSESGAFLGDKKGRPSDVPHPVSGYVHLFSPTHPRPRR